MTIRHDSPGKEPKFIYSGEMHYFRIPKTQWRDRLLKAKKAGLNTVSSYVPWAWHEPSKGKFDFTGRTDPQRDLVTFINLTKKMGLFFLARIGPVCNGEMIDEGLPGWLLKNNPQIYLKGKELAGLPHATLLSYLNPTYLDYIRKWYDKVLPIIKNNQISEGGNIILLQLDNEIGMIHWLNKAADYSTETTKLYREWLERKYEDISCLNKAYGTKYKRFSEVEQPDGDSDTEKIIVLNDWSHFYRWYRAKYYDFLAELAREYGIDLPLQANIPHFYDYDIRGRGIYSPMTTCMFGDFARFVPEVRFGGAYQMRRLDYDNFHDIPLTTEAVRMITSPGVPVFCAELQTGKLNDRPRIYPADVELNLKTTSMHGIDGVNSYMFCGGVNPELIGAAGKYHEWQAPVSSTGEIKTHFRPMELFGKFIKTFGDKLGNMQKVSDTTLGFYTPYYATEYFKGKFVEEYIEMYRNRFFYDGIARMITLNSINYDFADIRRCSLDDLLNHKTLWVFSMDFMDEQTQEKLADYVSFGGNLIIYPAMPKTDLSGRKSTLLMDRVGIKVTDTVKAGLVSMKGMDVEIAVEEKVSIMKSSGADVIATTTKDRKPCALLKRYGKGKVLAVGFGTPHLFNYHIDMVRNFAKLMNIEPSVSVDPHEVNVVMRKDGCSGFLLVANYQDEQKKCRLKLCLPGENKKSSLPSKGTILLDDRTALILPLNVRISPEIILKYSTAEVLGCKAGTKIMIDVIGSKESDVEILLSMKKPARVYVDNEKIKFGYSRGMLTLRFKATGCPQKVIIA